MQRRHFTLDAFDLHTIRHNHMELAEDLAMSNRSLTVACRMFLLSVVLLLTGADAARPQTPNEYSRLLDEFLTLSVDNNKIAPVSQLTVRRDEGIFLFEDGTFYFCKPVQQRYCAALFFGKGRFTLRPPTDIERGRLQRVYEKESADERFNFLFMMFADSTYEELTAQLAFEDRRLPFDIKSRMQHAMSFLSDKDREYFHSSFIKTFLEGRRNELFYAHFSFEKFHPKFFMIDPYQEEEVHFMQSVIGLPWSAFQSLTQFHTKHEYEKSLIRDDESKSGLNIQSYAIESTISKNLDFNAVAKVRFSARVENEQWFQFYLYHDLEVRSVMWGDGTPLPFFKGDKNPFLWIKSPKTLAQNELCSLTVSYGGDLLERRINPYIPLRSSITWYPRHRSGEAASFELTFHYPSKYKFVSIGNRISESTQGDMTTSRWVTAQPTNGSASFSVGFFTEIRLVPKEAPPLTLFVFEKSRRPTRHVWDPVTLGRDLESIVGFYHSLLGEYPFSQLAATEIVGLHGEAFPGLVHLSWASSLDHNKLLSEFQIYRAHELAHQWWGVGVGTKSYHDTWISEAFSEYFSLMYMQSLLNDNTLFYAFLERAAQRIINNRKFAFGDGVESDPVWLGSRGHPNDYGLIVYQKGAFVLHMLRVLLLDLNTMNERRFVNMMREFYHTYKGKKASTADFQSVVEKYAGDDMSWFFEQWVKNNKVPRYLFSHKTFPAPDGQFIVKFRVKQENVPPDFRAYVNVLVRLSDDRAYRSRVLIAGEQYAFDLPVPSYPEKVLFNDLGSVLCEVKEVDWKGE
ncbi:MAG: hypothetical protein KF749_06465 [Bacteroidetes bacterium]|nr:hypothetical protein [Bacteroidota bacterium]MCW5896875.1 hypothetical protein [Bacteroidota bacterium]